MHHIIHIIGMPNLSTTKIKCCASDEQVNLPGHGSFICFWNTFM